MTQKKKRFTFRRIAFACVVLFVALIGLGIYLIQRPPAIYRSAQQVLELTTENSREVMTNKLLDRLTDLTNDAENVEINEFALPKAGDPDLGRIDAFGNLNPPPKIAPLIITEDDRVDRFVQMTLSNEELVSFVHEMFVDWTIQRGYIIPGGVSDPVVMARNGELVVAFNIQTPYWQQVFSGTLELDFGDNGMAIGKMTKLHAGSLPISLISIKDMLRMQMPADQHDDADRIGEWLSQLDRFEFRPVIELDKRRRARVYEMEVDDAGVALKLRVQDHATYRHHNYLLGKRKLAVTDSLGPEFVTSSPVAGVPTRTD